MATLSWLQRGAIFQICPRSFADWDGDGVGDLPGLGRTPTTCRVVPPRRMAQGSDECDGRYAARRGRRTATTRISSSHPDSSESSNRKPSSTAATTPIRSYQIRLKGWVARAALLATLAAAPWAALQAAC
jgi:hypothetical protein